VAGHPVLIKEIVEGVEMPAVNDEARMHRWLRASCLVSPLAATWHQQH